MGRYISGDLEGKCWFGVQPSDFADRFGRMGDSSHIEYWFENDDLPNIEKELKMMEKQNGEYFKKLDEFFETHKSYAYEEIEKLPEVQFDILNASKNYVSRQCAICFERICRL